jgi:TonB family protein
MSRVFLAFILSLSIHLLLIVPLFWVSLSIFQGSNIDKKEISSKSNISIKYFKLKQIQDIKQPKENSALKDIKADKIVKKEIDKRPLVKKSKDVSSKKSLSSRYISLNRSKIYEAIQRVKRYPSIAKRLHIEGLVRITFTLTTSSKVVNLKTVGARDILQKSAKETIYKAARYFPKPIQNVTISVPINYTLR